METNLYITESDIPIDDLVCEAVQGYDLSLMRSIRDDGLIPPITVQPIEDHWFKVVDGQKRMAVIRLMVRSNNMVYDALSGLMRPAPTVFAFLRCRREKGGRR